MAAAQFVIYLALVLGVIYAICAAQAARDDARRDKDGD